LQGYLGCHTVSGLLALTKSIATMNQFAPSLLCCGQNSTGNPKKRGRMINRRTRSHLSCQRSYGPVCGIAESPALLPSVIDDLVGWRIELGVTTNLAMMDKSKSIGDT